MSYMKSGLPWLYDDVTGDIVGVKDQNGGELNFVASAPVQSANFTPNTTTAVAQNASGTLTALTLGGVAYTVTKDANGLVTQFSSASDDLATFPVLDYTSTDPSIVLKSSLTSAASVTAPAINTNGATGTVVGATFDATLGMKPSASGGAGCIFTYAAAIAALNTEGQISIEVESFYLNSWNAISASYSTYNPADDSTDIKYFLQWDTVNSGGAGGLTAGNWGALRKSCAGVTSGASANSGGMSGKVTDSDAANAGSPVNSWGKPAVGRFSRVTLAWRGNIAWMYINGYQMNTPATCTQNVLGMMSYICCGALSHTSGRAPQGVYFRNFLLSTKAPRIAYDPKFKHVATFGDSFSTANAAPTTNEPYTSGVGQDEMLVLTTRNQMLDAGINPGKISAFGRPGGFVVGQLSADASHRIDNAVATLITAAPSHLIWSGGNNDVESAGYTHALFLAHIQNVFLQIAYGCPDLKLVIINTIPYHDANAGSNTVGIHANITDANSILAALPAWWAQYHRCPMILVDQYTILGSNGLTVPNVFAGQAAITNGYTTTLSNFHPSGEGNRLLAQAGILPALVRYG